ncbi:hypothetical protein QMK33_14715 [Hymenobacter sp. H14-R3]|uniref:hypothetical protein n=1 Tax=Hymenobacter sp. H14-R3 TaxID=3046308 RepID=UPI0024BB00AB|nr:hypothetical protein [Hymenobacter sp. H14-R3]MDJ0366408.1 hypothetical protein [Hymenobacter sp. H14-R3]
MITVNFGEPARGWLPITFRAGTFELVLDAADVPVNPLESLCEALAVVSAEGNAQVFWHLEPAECRFDFKNQAAEITLTLAERPTRTRPFTQIFQVTGTSKEMLMPFYRALAQFASHSYSEAHWPTLSKHKLVQLGSSLKKSR